MSDYEKIPFRGVLRMLHKLQNAVKHPKPSQQGWHKSFNGALLDRMREDAFVSMHKAGLRR